MGIKKKKNSKLTIKLPFIEVFVSFASSLLLCFIWFFKGKELAGGEAGIFFYTAKNNLEYLTHSWSEVIIGAHAAYTVAIQPLLKIIIFGNEKLSIPFFLLQAIVFFLVLFSVQFSIGYITKKIYKNISRFGIISAQLFSILNLGVIAFVWNRFQYPFIIFYALFPVSIALIYMALSRGKKYILLLNIILYIFAFSLTSLPLLSIYWGFLFIFFLYLYFSHEKKIDVLLVFGIHTCVWLLLNFWWLHQFYLALKFSPFITTSAYTQSGNLSTLKSLSEHLGDLAYLMRLMHKDFYSEVARLWGLYETPLFVVLSYVPTFFVFGTLFLKSKSRDLVFFLTLSIMVLFLAKGTENPFGYIFEFLFTHIRLLESFRNPIEKFALVLPIFYAPLFGIGIDSFRKYLVKAKNGSKITLLPFIVTALVVVVLVFPLWTGQVFMSSFKPQNDVRVGYKIEIPTEYKSLNNFLEKENPSRIIVLPLGPEGITNSWKYGYTGVEQSSNLLVVPAISFNNGTEYLSQNISDIQKVAINDPKNFSKLMMDLGADGILVRSDIDWTIREMKDPSYFNRTFEELPEYEKKFENTLFTYYALTNKENQIFSSNSSIRMTKNIDLRDSLYIGNSMQQIPKVNLNKDNNLGMLESAIISKSNLPRNVNEKLPYITLEEATRILPHSLFLPGSRFFPLLLLKEKMDNPHGSEEIFYQLNIVNKRLAELYYYTSIEDRRNSLKSLKLYKKQLNEYKTFVSTIAQAEFFRNFTYILHIFASQKTIIDEISKRKVSSSFSYDLQRTFARFMVDTGQLPLFEFKPSVHLGAKRSLFEITIEKDGDYELLLESDGLGYYNFDLSKLPEIQIDDTLKNVSEEMRGKVVSLGAFRLKKGVHEVQLPEINPKNLVPVSDLTLHSSKNQVKTITLGSLNEFADYEINFKYKFEKGEKFELRVIGSEGNNFKKSTIIAKREFTFSPKNTKFQYFTQKFTTSGANQYYAIQFVLRDYKDCNLNSFIAKFFCNINLVKGKIGEGIFKISDVSVNRILSNKILAIANIRKIEGDAEKITYKKMDPTKYVLHFNNIEKPILVSFLQKFHRGWHLTYEDSEKSIDEQSHILINTFANGWVVDRKGTYDMLLEFVPENDLVRDRVVSVGTLFVIALLSFLLFVKDILRKK